MNSEPVSALGDDQILDLYRIMLRIRRFEEQVIAFYGEQEMKTPVHLCIGQEAVAAGVCIHLRDQDFLFSTHRNHGHCLAKGMAARELLTEFYGKKTGCAAGKGGSMHPVAPEKGIMGTTAIVGGGIPLAVGTALAAKVQDQDRIAVVFFGDGASEEGTFHESLNFAALHQVPVLFVCENNLYATASPIRQRQPGVSIVAHAAGYGLPGFQVDGNDAVAVADCVGQAVQRARDGQGATLIEAKTYRWFGHVGPNDDTVTGHRPAEELATWKKRCPLAILEQKMRSLKLWDPKQVADWEAVILDELQKAVQAGKDDPLPTTEDLLTHVFATV